MRYMADSTDCASFPAAVTVPGAGVKNIDLRAGYINGKYLSAGCSNVSIDVIGNRPDADVLDIELGDATPDTAPGWTKSHNAKGGYPAVLYCNRATISAVANALAAAGLQVVKDYRWWIARLDGIATVPDMTGVTAVQTWGASYFPNNIDLSVVYDDAWKAPVPGVYGAIGQKYYNTPGLASLLGPPITTELGTPDGIGRFNHFANSGSIYWTPTTGAFAVYGGIRALWAANGWETGVLGYPLSDEFGVSTADSAGNPLSYRQSNFQHGYIAWNAAQGAVQYH